MQKPFNPNSTDHPDWRPGDVFLENYPRSEPDAFQEIVNKYPQSARAGDHAFDTTGCPLSHHASAFASEVEKRVHEQEVKIGQ
jgi:hypothetical protein